MAHVYAARACLPAMIKKGGGYFLQIISAALIMAPAILLIFQPATEKNYC